MRLASELAQKSWTTSAWHLWQKVTLHRRYPQPVDKTMLHRDSCLRIFAMLRRQRHGSDSTKGGPQLRAAGLQLDSFVFRQPCTCTVLPTTKGDVNFTKGTPQCEVQYPWYSIISFFCVGPTLQNACHAYRAAQSRGVAPNSGVSATVSPMSSAVSDSWRHKSHTWKAESLPEG